MAVEYHTHEFSLPTASTDDIRDGTSTTSVITPAELKPVLFDIKYKVDTVADVASLSLPNDVGVIEALGRAVGGDCPIPIILTRTALQEEGGVTDANGDHWRIANTVLHPAMFADNDEPGVTDMTDAVRSMHEYANKYGLEVSYRGVGEMAIDAAAQIVINTSTDFEGWVPVILNGIVPDEDHTWDPDMTIFFIEDPDTPLTPLNYTISGLSSADKGPASRVLTQGAYQGPGFIYVYGNGEVGENTGLRVPPRFDGGTPLRYQQPFAIDHEGRALRGLSADMSGFSTIFARYRDNPLRGWITIRGLSIDTLQFNNAHLLHVRRNCVTVKDCHFYKSDPSSTAETLNRLIHVRDCAWVKIEDIRATGQVTNIDEGTYVIRFERVAEVRMENVNATGSWSCMVSDHVNGLEATGCNIRRIDGHSGWHNIYVHNCTLIDRGISFGWGGGTLHMTDCQIIDDNVAQSRNDYASGHWFGIFIIENIEVISSSNTVHVVDMRNHPIGSEDLEVQCPTQIVVRNVRVNGDDNRNGTRVIVPVGIAVKSTAVGVRAPAEIHVSNIVCDDGWRLQMPLDFANMKAGSTAPSSQHFIHIHDVHPTLGATSGTRGITCAANTLAGAGVTTHWYLRDMRNIDFDVSNLSSNTRVYANDVEFIRCVTADTVRLELNNCRFITPLLLGSETIATLGGTSSSPAQHTIINGGVVRGAWDFSKAGSIIGLNIADGSVNSGVVLPSGCTRHAAFTGWQTTTLYSDQSASIPSYTVAQLGTGGMVASSHSGRFVWASNANGGAGALCRSNGTDWIDLGTGSAVTT